MKFKKGLVTGSAGFIGFHLVSKLIKLDYHVVGLDVINNYYDINLKYERLNNLGIPKELCTKNKLITSKKHNNFSFLKADLADHEFIVKFIKKNKFDFVINLAAQPGVRYSLQNPRAYTHSNIDGFLSILEGCRFSEVKHLIYASTSSLYGLNSKMPLAENDFTSHPMALYAATKKANELMAHSYSHLFGIPSTGLRFFTVYGPWGRPDMSYFLFANAITKGEKIKVFNHGKMIRDFTYIDDIVESINRLIDKPPKINFNWNSDNPKPRESSAPYRICNIGNSNPTNLMDFIKAIENELGLKASKIFMDIQPGDVYKTHSDSEYLENLINYKPKVDYKVGVKKFIKWYKSYYKI